VSSRIPPEHPAAKSLEHAFRSLGAERVQERRRDRSGRVWRIGVATLAPVLAVAAVATGTKVFTGDGGSLPTDRSGARDPANRNGGLTPSIRQLALATAPNPTGGAPWGMRSYRNAIGHTCLSVGQVVRGRIGFVRAGQFKELPAGYASVCGTIGRQHFLIGRRAAPDGSNVLYGTVDRTVRRLHILRSTTGQTWEVEIADDGTFVVARAGRKAFFHQMLVADGSGGRTSQALDPA
jgi:hypothetical protein